MAFISQRNTGSVWDKRARYIEQSTSALQRYVKLGDEYARRTKMQRYTPKQTEEADTSLYERLLKDEQTVKPGRMPERSSGTATTSLTTGWGPQHLAISGISHQPLIQTAHHSGHRPYIPDNDISVPLMEHDRLQNMMVGHSPVNSTPVQSIQGSINEDSNQDDETPMKQKLTTPARPTLSLTKPFYHNPSDGMRRHATSVHKGMDPYETSAAIISDMVDDMVEDMAKAVGGPSSSPLPGSLRALHSPHSSKKQLMPLLQGQNVQPIPGNASGSGLQTVPEMPYKSRNVEDVMSDMNDFMAKNPYFQESEAIEKRNKDDFEKEKKESGLDEHLTMQDFMNIKNQFNSYRDSLSSHIKLKKVITRTKLIQEQKKGGGDQEEAAIRLKNEAHQHYFKIYDSQNGGLLKRIKKKHPKTYAVLRQQMLDIV